MVTDWATFGVDLHVEVNPSAGRRTGLERAIRDAVRAGRLAPRTRLPSTRALAAQLRMSRNTVAAAYDQLVAEGYLSARPGSGTVVAGQPRPAAPTPAPALGPPPPRYDLRPGSPDTSTFPTAAWLRSARRALSAAPTSVYGYGDARGHPALRNALAGYLGRARGVQADPGQIVITAGYVQGLALLAGVLAAAGTPVIAMEDPGLGFHRDVATRAGARVVPLPVDALGARTDLLGTGDLSGVAAAVLTPAHQYPTGVTLHPRRRQAATEWARATGGVVIEDDYDGEFRYDRHPVGALQGTAPDQVAYLGTASKTLGPALRLAWLVPPARLLARICEAKRYADGHSEVLGQLTLADLIESHAYDRHIRAIRARYRRRRDLLVSWFTAAGGSDMQVSGIAAGLHAMINLPPGGPSEAAVVTRLAEHGVAVGELAGHWHEHDPAHREGLIVGYGTPTEGTYPTALDILVRTVRGSALSALSALSAAGSPPERPAVRRNAASPAGTTPRRASGPRG